MLQTLPTTNTRIVVTLALVVATAVRFLVWGPPPAAAALWTEWLVFLGVLAGVDVGQYATKRVTFREPAADCPPAPEPTRTTRATAARQAPAVTLQPDG